MKCKSCGYEFGPKFSSKFCPECGTSTYFGDDKIRCRKCNYEMDSNLKYCPECGESNNSDHKKRNEYRNRRDKGGDDDDEGGILGGIGDVVGKLFGG